jgi:hypothetical protein
MMVLLVAMTMVVWGCATLQPVDLPDEKMLHMQKKEASECVS